MRSYFVDRPPSRQRNDNQPHLHNDGVDPAAWDPCQIRIPNRYVIPPAHAEQAHALEELATECSLDFEGGPGMGGSGPFGEGSGVPTPIAVENFQMLKDRQTSDSVVETEHRRGRTNLLNWDGRGKPQGLFPKGHHDKPKDDSGKSDSSEGHS